MIGDRLTVPRPSRWEGGDTNWRAVKRQLRYDDYTGGEFGNRVLKTRFALVRDDTNDLLGIVSHRYEPVQPSTLLSMFDELCERIGGFKVDRTGTLKGGKKLCAFASSKDHFTLPGKDKVERHLLLATSYDCSLSTMVIQTAVRMACWNQLRAILKRDDTVVVRYPHRTLNVETRLREELQLDEGWKQFVVEAEKLSQQSIQDAAARRYFFHVLYPEEVQKRSTFSKRAAQRQSDRLFDVYKSAPGQDLKSAAGTLWGAVNAVSFWVDHMAWAREDDNRLDRAWFGRGARLKARAVSQALLQAA